VFAFWLTRYWSCGSLNWMTTKKRHWNSNCYCCYCCCFGCLSH